MDEELLQYMKNIVFVVGTRPNFVKIAPLLDEAQKNYLELINPILVHTGQHYDANMSDIFFDQLNISISPICFNIGSGTPAQQIYEIMDKFSDFFKTAPVIDMMIIVGDVNSSVAAALAATKANIPIAHVEAGLRSFDKTMPEETNRIIIDALSYLFFTTEPSADENLRSEGHKENIYRVGNVMIDSLKKNITLSKKINAYSKYDLKRKNYIFSTIHRVSNIDNERKLSCILKAIRKVSGECHVLLSTHPGTHKKINEFHLNTDGVTLIDSVGYLESLNLIANAKMVVTDSGGIQEETAFMGIPCVTLRKSTERPITVDCGTNVIAGDDEDQYERIILETLSNLSTKNASKIPLWDGKASERILKVLIKILQDL